MFPTKSVTHLKEIFAPRSPVKAKNRVISEFPFVSTDGTRNGDD